MRRFRISIILVIVIVIGILIGSRFLGSEQKVYHAPMDYTETVEGLNGLKVR